MLLAQRLRAPRDEEDEWSFHGTPREEPDEGVLLEVTALLPLAENLPSATVFLHEWRGLEGDRWKQALEMRRRYEAQLVALLMRPEGASVEEIGMAFGWQPVTD